MEEEYVQLIQANEGIIHKVIQLHVDDAEDRKDLFQEILLQAWKSFSGFQGKASFSTWLYRVALNTVFTFKRKQKPKLELKETILKEQANEASKSEGHEVLYQLIKQLDPIDRTLISLHFDAYKNKEIAEITGLTANHVNVKIHRLKNQLIEKLKNQGYGSK